MISGMSGWDRFGLWQHNHLSHKVQIQQVEPWGTFLILQTEIFTSFSLCVHIYFLQVLTESKAFDRDCMYVCVTVSVAVTHAKIICFIPQHTEPLP